jgi:di/tricarboxylate transporter
MSMSHAMTNTALLLRRCRMKKKVCVLLMIVLFVLVNILIPRESEDAFIWKVNLFADVTDAMRFA